MKTKFILFLLLIGHLGFSTEPSQAIKVQLETQKTLSPIYLSHIQSKKGLFPSNYLRELEKVLEFNFSYNGRTKLVTKTQEKDSLLRSCDAKPKNLKTLSAPFAVSFFMEDNRLMCKLYNLIEVSAKTFSSQPLIGALSQDRRNLHALSNAIYKSLFKEESIMNSRILYAYKRDSSTAEGSWHSNIMECDWDGENVKSITKEKSYCVTPVLIPKGKGLAEDLFLYVSYKTGQPKIYISSLKEGVGKKAVDIRGNQLLPAISKNRDKLAFVCDASGRTDLFVQTIEPATGRMGTPIQLFSFPRSTQGSPTFSPDGKMIAFVSDKDGPTRIYSIPAEKQAKRPSPQLITKKNRESSCPSWSPDGTKLAYSAKTDGIRQIWTYDFTTKEEKQLTTGPGNKENPCWASNSLHIVFNSTGSNSTDLYIVNLNQPEAIKISKGLGTKHYPTWANR